jgi:NADPH:quinone reductase-like Zn-dependent oxidoreductase
MRAIVAERFGGYQNLKLADIPQPTVSNGRVLVRITAAGVTPLDHTILSGDHPRAKAPLVLGNEGETTGFRMVPGLCSRGHTVSTRMARSVNGLR